MTARHEVQWVTAAPLWRGRPVTRGVIDPPDLVRFESDDFMEDLEALLAKEPKSLADRVATAKSYRAHPSGAPRDWEPSSSALRLYQPVHGHFNLVVASLVCAIPGLPDHGVDPAKGDETWFVLRRLRKGSDVEMAWVTDGEKRHVWSPIEDVARRRTVIDGEQLLPMFMVPFTEGDRTRRLWAGLVPTSSRETFAATREAVPEAFASEAEFNEQEGESPPPRVPDPRVTDPEIVEARARVIAGLQALQTPRPSPPLTPPSTEGAMEVELTRFFLLDLAHLLSNHAPAVMGARSSMQPKARALYDALPTGMQAKLAKALAEWRAITGESDETSSLNDNLRGISLDLRDFVLKLDDAIEEHTRSLPAASTSDAAKAPGAELPQLDDAETRYVIRCVYRRTKCRPPRPDVVSRGSAEFTIAPYFDPDAPARPIRIALPIDTSLKGLRKFRKSVAFLMSNQLRKQMSQATNLKDLLDKKAGEEEPFTLGEICSFSIPIITLCAFIVLMIFMVLLNFVFWWLPLLRFCFPIPKRR